MAEYGSKTKSTEQVVLSDNREKKGPTFLGLEIFPNKTIANNKLKVPQKDLLVFFRQLSVMLTSGVPLAQGLQLLSENMGNKKFALCIIDISKRLQSGEDLSSSLKLYPRIFPTITIGLIQAGEAGGILSQVLDRIALLIEAQSKIKSQIQGALIYPVLILVLAVSVSLGLLIFIVPKFDEMFKGMGAELPALTRFMLTLSRLVTHPNFIIVAPISIVIGIFLFNKYYATVNGKLVIDRLILKIPLFGDLILRSEMASLSDTLSTLSNAGINLVEGLERCITAAGNEVIRRALNKSIVLVKEGQELSYSLGLSKVIPGLVVSMVRIGEETGALPYMLDNIANFYKREVEETVSNLTTAMEPLIISVVAGIVGTIVISLYLPMFSLINNMGK